MSVERAAFITFHACPLAAPGQGKSGGMNVYVRELARALGSQGMEVDIFTREHPGASNMVECVAPGVRVVHLPGGDSETPMEDLYTCLPGFLEAVQDYVKENGLEYQVVHSHYWLSGWVGRGLAQTQQIPHVVTFHTLGLIKMQSRAGEMEPPQREIVERELMASVQGIVAFSPHERDAMVRLYGANAERVTLIPCGVDLSLFKPLDQEEVRDRLGLNGEKVVLYVGRLEALKGLELLVEAAAQMETCEEVRTIVVGDGSNGGEDLERIRQLAQTLQVEDRIDFVGRVDHEDLPLYYNAADVCVLPSYYESFGLAALEAMACGTPVVASRVGGLPTIIQHGRTGYLKSWRCPEAFANSLDMIISNPTLQQSMGQASRRRAEDMGWERVASDMANIYQSLT